MVMFRDFTMRHARKLKITGFVRNEKDGSVFSVAEGEEENLNKLIEDLKRGNVLSRVDDVKTEWKEPTGEFSGFNIEY